MEEVMSIRCAELDYSSGLGRASFTYTSIGASAIHEAIDYWKQFCNLGMEDKLRLAYEHLDGLGIGYEYKPGIGGTFDRKENFHVNMNGMDRLRTLLQEYPQDDVQRSLILATNSLVDAIAPLAVEYANAIEMRCGITGLVSEVLSGISRWLFRYLHYFEGHTVGDEIASAHADKSGFTIYLYESTSGVEWLDASLQWKGASGPIIGYTVMPGMQLQYRTQGVIKAMYHRVVADEYIARHGRYAMVCFIPLMNTPKYDKVRAGRLQDALVGFNYSMPFEKFAELFV